MFNVDRKPQSKIYIMSNESHSVRIRCWYCVAYSFFYCIMNICISFPCCRSHGSGHSTKQHTESSSSSVSLWSMYASRMNGRSRQWWQQISSSRCRSVAKVQKNEIHIYFATFRDCHMTAFAFGRNTHTQNTKTIKYVKGKLFGSGCCRCYCSSRSHRCRWTNSFIVVRRHCRRQAIITTTIIIA